MHEVLLTPATAAKVQKSKSHFVAGVVVPVFLCVWGDLMLQHLANPITTPQYMYSMHSYM